MIELDRISKLSALCEKKNRIVIVADSLSMPRPDEGLQLEDTYPYLLSKLLNHRYEVINRGKRANIITDQIRDQAIYDDIIVFYPRIVVLQIGIVDCAPRLFSRRFDTYVIGNIRPPSLQRQVIGLFSRNRRFLTKHFPKQYVALKEFSAAYGYLLSIIHAFGSKAIAVNIARTSEENCWRSIGFLENIQHYNAVIETKAKVMGTPVIDVYGFSEREKVLLADGIHYDARGSQLVAQKIATLVDSIENLGLRSGPKPTDIQIP